MSAFGSNLIVNQINNKPFVNGTGPTDTLTCDTVVCQTIGSIDSPLETMHIGSDIRYQNDIKFIDTQDPLNEREQMSLLTDG